MELGFELDTNFLGDGRGFKLSKRPNLVMGDLASVGGRGGDGGHDAGEQRLKEVHSWWWWLSCRRLTEK